MIVAMGILQETEFGFGLVLPERARLGMAHCAAAGGREASRMSPKSPVLDV
jgi:hypothetical protein